MSDCGANQRPIRPDHKFDDLTKPLRGDFEQRVNGHLCEAYEIDGHTFVRLNGKPFAGTFVEAIQAAAKKPIRWSGVFE